MGNILYQAATDFCGDSATIHNTTATLTSPDDVKAPQNDVGSCLA